MIGSPQSGQKLNLWGVSKEVLFRNCLNRQWLVMRGEGQGRWTAHFGPHVLTDDFKLAEDFSEMESA
jgi:hypothetical protein